MERLIIDGFGKFVGRRGNQIVVKEKGKEIHYTLAEDLRQVLISGGGSISFDALTLLADHGVDVLVIDWKGDVKARLSFPEMRTVTTRREQYYAYLDARGGHLAIRFVLAKVKNQYAVLGTLAKVRADTSPEDSSYLMKMRREVSEFMEPISSLADRPVGEIRQMLMGMEGTCSQKYWAGIARVIPERFGFQDRSGRHATDGVNAMLNYGYGILQGEVWRAVHFSGLDPFGGFLHADRPGKPSMVLDLMEEFRQQFVDKTVIAIISRRQVSPDDFEMKDGLCRMSDRARRLLLMHILQKTEDYIRYKGKKIRWCDLMVQKAREVAKYLRGEVREYEGFYLRW